MEGDIPQQRADHPALRHAGVGGMPPRILHIPGFEPLLDQPLRREVAQRLQQGGMPDVIKRPNTLIPPSRTRATNPPKRLR
jgi:hypothetical protein